MKKAWHALEITARLENADLIRLDSPLPRSAPQRLRVIVLLGPVEEAEEIQWLQAGMSNPAFAFLNEPEEDIYTLSDGKPLTHAGVR